MVSRSSITGKTLFLTSATFAYGVHGFAIPPLPQTGGYTIVLDATDLAGNYNQMAATLQATH